MRCAAIILAWAIGVPIGAGIVFVVFGALMVETMEAVVRLGFSENVGCAVFMVAMFAGLGTAAGIHECQGRR